MILKLALRNALRQGKSSLLVVIFIVAIGMVFTMGNSLFVHLNQSMSQGFRNSITGDFVIMAQSDEPMGLFGANIPSISEFFSIPELRQTEEILESLEEMEWIEGHATQLSGQALFDSRGYRNALSFFGVSGESHFQFFPDLQIIEGSHLSGSEGILIPQALAEAIEKKSGEPVTIGEPIKLSSMGRVGVRIRQLPLLGIYRFPYSDPLLDSLVLIDSQTARELLSVASGEIQAETVTENSDLLAMDLDDLFSMDFAEGDQPSQENDILNNLENLFSTPLEQTDEGKESQGIWHFILVKKQEDMSYSRALDELENLLQDYPVDLLSWRQAAGQSATYGHFLQLFFYAGFILILVAGIIGIVNIMLISVFDRSKEIGTIQALGGTPSFIAKLLLLEYLILTVAGAIISLILSWLLFRILNGMEIGFSNRLINMILGGKSLFFPLTPGLSLTSFIIVLFTGVSAALYPINRALALEPVEAIRGER